MTLSQADLAKNNATSVEQPVANNDLQCACRAGHMSPPVYSSTSVHELTRFEGYQAQFVNHTSREAFIHVHQRRLAVSIQLHCCDCCYVHHCGAYAPCAYVPDFTQPGQAVSNPINGAGSRQSSLPKLGFARPGRLQQGRRTWATCARMRCLAVPCMPSLKTTAHTQKLSSSQCEYTGVV